jgi:hypothetical protein
VASDLSTAYYGPFILSAQLPGRDLFKAMMITANHWPQCQRLLEEVASAPDQWFNLRFTCDEHCGTVKVSMHRVKPGIPYFNCDFLGGVAVSST